MIIDYMRNDKAPFTDHTVKPKENENITFRMKGGMTMALMNGIRMKKGVSGPSTQESLSQNRSSRNYLW